MAMRGPLRREIGKYRKRGPGTMPGYLGFKGWKQHVTGAMPGPAHGGYPTDLYMWGVPRDYHPNINAPAAQSDEYITDPDWESHHVPRSHQERLLRPFPQREPNEPGFDYDAAMAHSEFFLKAMEAQYRPLVEGEEVPTLAEIWRDHITEGAEQESESRDYPDELGGIDALPEEATRRLPDLADIADALGHLQKVFPDDHPDIVNLRAAAHEILQHPELLPQPEDFHADWSESKLGNGNPYEMDMIDDPEVPATAHTTDGPFEQKEAAFGQPMQTLDEVFGTPEFGLDEGPAMVPDGYADLEAMLGTPEAAFAEPDGLERMIEQEGPFGAPPAEIMDQDMMPDAMGSDMGIPGVMPEADSLAGMTPEDEINQAMDAAAGQPGPHEMEPEPDPFQMQYDPFATAQQVFDRQMQYMDNPFMMPGPAPGM